MAATSSSGYPHGTNSSDVTSGYPRSRTSPRAEGYPSGGTSPRAGVDQVSMADLCLNRPKVDGSAITPSVTPPGTPAFTPPRCLSPAVTPGTPPGPRSIQLSTPTMSPNGTSSAEMNKGTASSAEADGQSDQSKIFDRQCSSATNSSMASEEPPTPAGSEAGFDDRMARWAKRKEEKLLRQAQKKKLGLNLSGGPAQSVSNTCLSSVQGMITQKGLPLNIVDVLGSGSFAKVYEGTWTKDTSTCAANTTVAVKLINVQDGRLGPDGEIIPPRWLEREVKTSFDQNHENLTKVLQSSIESLPYVIVLEYCAGGALHELVAGDMFFTLQKFSWTQRIKSALDVAVGMAHLHGQKIVHRDLKTQNVLLVNRVLSVEDAVHAKVCDFGVARYLPEDDRQTKLSREVGSWYSMAPELYTDQDQYDTKVDVYSYAMILYEMLAGSFYFEGKNMSCAQFVVFAFNGGRPKLDVIPETAPPVLLDLMSESWSKDTSIRPDFLQIAERLRSIPKPQEDFLDY